MINWFLKNPVAANLLMVAIVILGLFSLRSIPLEVFPSFELDIININTSFPGANPSSVESAVTVRIEEAIYDLQGIKRLSSRSSENFSFVTVEVASGTNARELLNDIKSRVDAIITLPTDAERPTVSIAERKREVISVVVAGNIDEKSLREVAERMRDQMLRIDGISTIDYDDIRDYEINIEIDPTTLEALNINLNDVATAINANSIDISAGNIKTNDGDILIRSYSQAYSAEEFGNIPVISTNNDGVVLLKDIANITDGFQQDPLLTLYNNQPAVILDIFRTGQQSAIDVAAKVRDFIEVQQSTLPPNITLSYWRDRSKIVKSRLNTLLKSAWQGGLLVIILLTLFLRPSVAFWVFLGIPIAFTGVFILMPILGVTLNIVSMFAFIVVLGIVVDDAIVTGENIYRHQNMGKSPLQAAMDGTHEVAVPVTFGILTTVAAFTPMLFLEGVRGAIFIQIPLIVIPVLLLSLVESKLILPSHMCHVKPYDKNDKPGRLISLQRKIAAGFENAILTFYQPALEKCLRNKTITLTTALAIMLVIFTYFGSGWMRFIFFPRVESEVVSAYLTMPTTTGFQTTNKNIEEMVKQAQRLQNKYRDPDSGESVITHILSKSGGINQNNGYVRFEVQSPDERVLDIQVKDIVSEWRKSIGTIVGAERLSFRAELGRSGEPLDIQLKGQNLDDMQTIADQVRQQLKTYSGVFDIQDNLSGGKDEFEISLKPQAFNLGISLNNIARQVRHAFFGAEAQRIQRGRNEVKVMVRYQLDYRSSLNDLYNLPIRLPNGATVKLSEVATITSGSSPSALYRVDRFRTLNTTADADKETVDIEAIKRELTGMLNKLLISYPGITYELEGEAKEQAETFGSIKTTTFLVLLAIYILLAIPFRSYLQPLIVMSIIPLGVVGSVIGHIITGNNLSIMSVLGMVALIGVVVNDSLVLVDYINKKRREGMEVMQAVLTAGAARFRPVMLTSLTTFAGLTPLLLEKSTQAQFLIPMAISLGFGILFATLVTLIIVPVNYVVLENIKALCSNLR